MRKQKKPKLNIYIYIYIKFWLLLLSHCLLSSSLPPYLQLYILSLRKFGLFVLLKFTQKILTLMLPHYLTVMYPTEMHLCCLLSFRSLSKKFTLDFQSPIQTYRFLILLESLIMPSECSYNF